MTTLESEKSEQLKELQVKIDMMDECLGGIEKEITDMNRQCDDLLKGRSGLARGTTMSVISTNSDSPTLRSNF